MWCWEGMRIEATKAPSLRPRERVGCREKVSLPLRNGSAEGAVPLHRKFFDFL